jgi:hypothetical protein
VCNELAALRHCALQTCTPKLKRTIVSSAYAGPRRPSPNSVQMVTMSESTSPVPSSAPTVARTTMPGKDL